MARSKELGSFVDDTLVYGNLRKLAWRLREERLKRGWTLEDVADKAGIDVETVRRNERLLGMGRYCRADTLIRHTLALGISIDQGFTNCFHSH
jgi:transcriptional regulator with XRE-family HTH domain